MIDHGGGIEGFNTFLAYYPEDKLTVVVLANLNGQAPDAIASKLAAVAHGENVVLPSERKEVTVSPAILAKYVGTYELMPDFDIVMTLEGGQLMTQAAGQPKFPLFGESETKFFLKVVDAEVEFFKNDKGDVTHKLLDRPAFFWGENPFAFVFCLGIGLLQVGYSLQLLVPSPLQLRCHQTVVRIHLCPFAVCTPSHGGRLAQVHVRSVRCNP